MLKQRNSLLKTAGAARRGSRRRRARWPRSTCGTTTSPALGAELLAARLHLVDELRPHVGEAYATVARGASRDDADIDYRRASSCPGRPATLPTLTEALLAALAGAGADELDRGISLVGPHRDELLLTLGRRRRARARPGCR